MITELITTGSLRQYTKKIRNPRIKVVKKWCSAILEGLQQLHINGVVHGNLSCESVYVNSNNGEIKLGDLGIKSVIRENCFELDNERLMCDPKKFDVYWFGMCLLEMLICSEVPGRMGVK